jgi:hypothetical protein
MVDFSYSALMRLEMAKIEKPSASRLIELGIDLESSPSESVSEELTSTNCLVSNFTTEFDEDSETESVIPTPMCDVISQIFEQTESWPRRVGSNLFVHDDRGIHWIDNAAALFGWLATKCGVIEWRKSVGCVTKEELFCELSRTAQSYTAVENLPHFPPRPDHYYSCKEYEPGDGDAISRLVQFFSPETPADRDLILGMFATPFWGGKPGSRPAFLITSDAGRGVGKSKITDMLSTLLGGHIELSAGEDATRMRTRLLSPEGLKLRLARLDNVKTLKFSWAEFESIVTSPLISGHRLHKGEASRPNNLIWTITLNGASLSTDMAQRVIIIKLAKPQRMGAWEDDVVSFIEKNRDAIISDIRAFLEMEPSPMPKHSRWASWEDEIVGRLSDPEGVQQIINERSQIADVEQEEIGLVEEYFYDRLLELDYISTTAVFIPSKIAAQWFNEATNEKRTVVASCRVLSQFCTEQSAKKIIRSRTSDSRGFIFSRNEVFDDPDFSLESKIISRRRRNDI